MKKKTDGGDVERTPDFLPFHRECGVAISDAIDSKRCTYCIFSFFSDVGSIFPVFVVI